MAYTPEQRRNIALANRLSAGHAPRVRQALLEAMGVESNFRNLNYGDRDSLGVLQQRKQFYPRAGQNVAYDIQQFLLRADRANKQVGGSAGTLAQAVQRSAFPGRYDEHAGQAAALLGGRFGGGGGSPGMQVVSRLGGAQTGAQDSTGAFKQALTSYLLQSSNDLASGHSPDSSGLLQLAELRQQLSQPSAPATALASKVRPGSYTGPPGQVQWEGTPLGGEKPDFLRKVSAAVSAIGGTKIRVNSGYRSPAHNRAVGGAPNSNHTYGRAMDGQAYIPGKGWVDLGLALRDVAPKFGLRSGASFDWGGRPDTPHVDDGFNQRH